MKSSRRRGAFAGTRRRVRSPEAVSDAVACDFRFAHRRELADGRLMRGNLTRREALRLTGAGLLGVGFAPGPLRAEEKRAPGEFTFIAVNDLHFHDEQCRPWFEQAVAQMKQSAPQAEFCLLGGDLSENGTSVQLNGTRDAFAQLALPIYPVVGNHDHASMMDRSAYELLFPGRINYRLEHKGWQVLALDTTEGTNALGTTIGPRTLRWLDENVPQMDPGKPTIVVTHFPLGPLVWGRPVNADEVLRRLAPLKMVAAIFSGHFHGYTERHVAATTLTTDKCCSRFRSNHDGTPEKGWFVCQATSKGEVTRKFVEFQAAG